MPQEDWCGRSAAKIELCGSYVIRIMSNSFREPVRKLLFLVLYVAVGVSSLLEMCAYAQQAPNPVTHVPKFDVISVRLREGYDRPAPIRLQWTASGYVAEGMPLIWLVGAAYGTRIALVTQVPAWANSKRFDISAKVAASDIDSLSRLSIGDRNSMLRQILDERFHVKVHPESRMSQVYELVIRKEGAKLAPSTQNPSDSSETPKKKLVLFSEMMSGENVPISDLASALWNVLGRKVIDKTGLLGSYSFTLKWTPEDRYMEGSGNEEVNPDIATALKEQLGLEIKPSKAPIVFLVLDQAEMPTPN